MKRSELFFTSILIPLDICAIIAAFTLAYFTRLQSDTIYFWSFAQYFHFILIFVLFWLVIFILNGLYKIKPATSSALDEFASIFFSVSTGIMLIVAYIFLSRTDFFSRLIIIYAWVYSIVLIFSVRMLLKLIQKILLKYRVGIYRVIIAGTKNSSKSIINAINTFPGYGMMIVKIIDRLGLEKINSILANTPADVIIITDPNISDKEVAYIIEETQDRHIDIKLVPNLFRLREAHLRTSAISGIPLISFQRTPLDGWGAIIKRAMDIIVGLILLLLLCPLLIMISLLVIIDSRGPIIYKNKRVGKYGLFNTLKFRTMKTMYCTGDQYGGSRAESFENKLIKEKNIKKGSAVYKIADDPRITRFGKFLRRTSLDELPQLINVLKGNMSLVGPRPHQPKEVINYTKQQKKLLLIKPGITGMAQISGRSDLFFDEEASLDIYYLENWSLWLDVKIFLRTIAVVLFSKGAY